MSTRSSLKRGGTKCRTVYFRPFGDFRCANALITVAISGPVNCAGSQFGRPLIQFLKLRWRDAAATISFSEEPNCNGSHCCEPRVQFSKFLRRAATATSVASFGASTVGSHTGDPFKHFSRLRAWELALIRAA